MQYITYHDCQITVVVNEDGTVDHVTVDGGKIEEYYDFPGVDRAHEEYGELDELPEEIADAAYETIDRLAEFGLNIKDL